jgi:hypothetical protein
MADYIGTRAASSTVRFSFTTHAASGAAVAPSSAFESADLRIYKDGSATQRSSANGITMTSPFDSVTGLHHVDIDLSDNSDSGFYAAGSFYEVHLVPDETVDSLAVVKVLAYFDIGVPVANVTQFGGTAGTFSGGRPEVNTTHAAGTAWASGAITAASLAADAITAAKVATDVTTEIQSGLATASALSTVAGYIDTEIAAIIADTEDIQSRLPAALVGGRIDATVDATGMESGAIDAILDDTIGDGSLTVRQALKLMAAVLAGKVSGASSTTITFRNTADSADVVTATVDGSGNRSAVTVAV